MTECISVVLNPQVCGDLLWQSEETNTLLDHLPSLPGSLSLRNHFCFLETSGHPTTLSPFLWKHLVHIWLVVWGTLLVMDWSGSPQNFYAEALNANVMMFRNRAFREITKIKWGHNGGALADRTGVLARKERDTREFSLHTTQRKDHMRTQKGGSFLQPKKRGLTSHQPW